MKPKVTISQLKDMVKDYEKGEELEYVAIPTDEEDEVVCEAESNPPDSRGNAVVLATSGERVRSNGERTAVEKLDDAIAVIDKLRTYYSRIRQAAIGVTQTEDWTNWGGRYRLNESGASKIMSQLGVHEETIETRKVSESWGYTIYITRRYQPSWNPSASFDAVGSCRSDDAFVAIRKVYDKELGRKVAKQIPPEEVDESNVLKAALANCRVNGIIAVCGLKTVAKEELDAAPYVNVNAIQEVSFGGGGKKKEWKPSEKQIAFAKKLGASSGDLEGAKSHRDFQQLIDKLKGSSDSEEREEFNFGANQEEDF